MLSTDLLLKVFAHLTDFADLYAVSEVCVSWRAACWLARNVEVDMSKFRALGEGAQFYTFAEAVATRFNHVRKVNLRGVGHRDTFPPEAGVDLILRKFDVGVVDVTYGQMPAAILRGDCPHLTEAYLSYTELGDDDVVRLARGCPRLEVLDVSYNNKIVGSGGALSNAALDCIGKSCGRLRDFTAAGMIYMTDVTPLAVGCPKLEKFDMGASIYLAKNGMIALARGCNRLASVYASHCQNMDDDVVKALASHCPLLCEVNIDHCYKLTDDAIRELAARCPDLVKVSLRGLHVTSAAPFAQSKKLTKLDVTGCARMGSPKNLTCTVHGPEYGAISWHPAWQHL